MAKKTNTASLSDEKALTQLYRFTYHNNGKTTGSSDQSKKNPSIQEVIITGEFDDWKATLPMVMDKDGDFNLTFPVTIPENRDKTFFKFVVDGDWKISQEYKSDSTLNAIENNYITRKDLLKGVSYDKLANVNSSRIPESGGLPVSAPTTVGSNKDASSSTFTDDIIVNHNNHSNDNAKSVTSTPSKKKKRIKIKKRIRRNKKTGETTILSEEVIILGDSEEDQDQDTTVISGSNSSTEDHLSSKNVKKDIKKSISKDNIPAIASVDQNKDKDKDTEFHILPVESENHTNVVNPLTVSEGVFGLGPVIVNNAKDIPEFTQIRDVDAKELNAKLSKQLNMKKQSIDSKNIDDDSKNNDDDNSKIADVSKIAEEIDSKNIPTPTTIGDSTIGTSSDINITSEGISTSSSGIDAITNTKSINANISTMGVDAKVKVDSDGINITSNKNSSSDSKSKKIAATAGLAAGALLSERFDSKDNEESKVLDELKNIKDVNIKDINITKDSDKDQTFFTSNRDSTASLDSSKRKSTYLDASDDSDRDPVPLSIDDIEPNTNIDASTSNSTSKGLLDSTSKNTSENKDSSIETSLNANSKDLDKSITDIPSTKFAESNISRTSSTKKLNTDSTSLGPKLSTDLSNPDLSTSNTVNTESNASSKQTPEFKQPANIATKNTNAKTSSSGTTSSKDVNSKATSDSNEKLSNSEQTTASNKSVSKRSPSIKKNSTAKKDLSEDVNTSDKNSSSSSKSKRNNTSKTSDNKDHASNKSNSKKPSTKDTLNNKAKRPSSKASKKSTKPLATIAVTAATTAAAAVSENKKKDANGSNKSKKSTLDIISTEDVDDDNLSEFPDSIREVNSDIEDLSRISTIDPKISSKDKLIASTSQPSQLTTTPIESVEKDLKEYRNSNDYTSEQDTLPNMEKKDNDNVGSTLKSGSENAVISDVVAPIVSQSADNEITAQEKRTLDPSTSKLAKNISATTKATNDISSDEMKAGNDIKLGKDSKSEENRSIKANTLVVEENKTTSNKVDETIGSNPKKSNSRTTTSDKDKTPSIKDSDKSGKTEDEKERTPKTTKGKNSSPSKSMKKHERKDPSPKPNDRKDHDSHKKPGHLSGFMGGLMRRHSHDSSVSKESKESKNGSKSTAKEPTQNKHKSEKKSNKKAKDSKAEKNTNTVNETVKAVISESAKNVQLVSDGLSKDSTKLSKDNSSLKAASSSEDNKLSKDIKSTKDSELPKDTDSTKDVETSKVSKPADPSVVSNIAKNNNDSKYVKNDNSSKDVRDNNNSKIVEDNKDNKDIKDNKDSKNIKNIVNVMTRKKSKKSKSTKKSGESRETATPKSDNIIEDEVNKTKDLNTSKNISISNNNDSNHELNAVQSNSDNNLNSKINDVKSAAEKLVSKLDPVGKEAEKKVISNNQTSSDSIDVAVENIANTIHDNSKVDKDISKNASIKNTKELNETISATADITSGNQDKLASPSTVIDNLGRSTLDPNSTSNLDKAAEKITPFSRDNDMLNRISQDDVTTPRISIVNDDDAAAIATDNLHDTSSPIQSSPTREISDLASEDSVGGSPIFRDATATLPLDGKANGSRTNPDYEMANRSDTPDSKTVEERVSAKKVNSIDRKYKNVNDINISDTSKNISDHKTSSSDKEIKASKSDKEIKASKSDKAANASKSDKVANISKSDKTNKVSKSSKTVNKSKTNKNSKNAKNATLQKKETPKGTAASPKKDEKKKKSFFKRIFCCCC
ncbi:hypothetical protein TBLA_0B09660 [Henningerozyma blattae CBS 6284]|uniref:AMP-activated protein kinase glycogen-binding domain-containing protein n=1 Tax=Henningerozyma blattae (strain ATCC 34711 / CBS 6284 / DSM 70876 / NBRC 10599 / NRRL Y-10934 / UCD 77-7) TaxID=1071380 RepID=I2H081_HENB6|nr:hypothetical protein TBLA_0B09660 [Tetrapisispora blattae CBS 6284]CCH59783.1 hypothetical protein TBLA_0B09660 [Tetrapisispora blattae CBS 6284]